MIDYSLVVGSVGVGTLLVAFLLNLLRLLSQDGYAYIMMNIVGAGLACYASVMIGYVPFVILEAVWMLVAVVGLARLVVRSCA